MSNTGGTARPIAVRHEEGEAFWFLGVLAVIKADGQATGGRFALIEQLAPKGSGSPLHVHQREDEWFYVIDGELTLWVGGRHINAPAGSFVYGPRGIPHTYTVASPTARFLVGAEPAGFDDFVRALAVPAQSRTIPPPAGQPPDPEYLTRVAAQYGIEILGPPGIPA
jgi:quercetin dioxygenase-like cupin family protein